MAYLGDRSNTVKYDRVVEMVESTFSLGRSFDAARAFANDDCVDGELRQRGQSLSPMQNEIIEPGRQDSQADGEASTSITEVGHHIL